MSGDFACFLCIERSGELARLRLAVSRQLPSRFRKHRCAWMPPKWLLWNGTHLPRELTVVIPAWAGLIGGDCANRLEPELLALMVSVFDRFRFDSEGPIRYCPMEWQP